MTNQPPSGSQVKPLGYGFTVDSIRLHMAESGAHRFAPPYLREWALRMGYSWDSDHELPEPFCGGCGSPINVNDGEAACPDCTDCESCCWDNHGGDPHGVSA